MRRFLLALVAAAALAGPAMAQTKTYPGVTAADLDALRAYPELSGQLRQQSVPLMQIADPAEREAKQQAHNKQVKDLDDAVFSTVKTLVADGYWKSQPRDFVLDYAVWLELQHHFDVPLVQQVLPDIKVLVDAKQFPAQNYALMYDRLDWLTNDKQLYGTQIVCTAKGWSQPALEDPEHIDALRKSMGIDQPVADFVAAYTSQKCVFTPPKPAK